MIWKCLFGLSSRDHGSLGYFKSLLNRTPVKKDPKKNVNTSLDFLLTVIKGHLLAAACQILGVTKLDSPLKLPPGIQRSSKAQQYEFLKTTATQVVEKFTLVGAALTRKKVVETHDGVHNSALVLCLYGALVMEFLDSWAEGDGDRAYRCWCLFLPHFLVHNRRKYALEALRLQFQIQAVLSPHLAHHVLWDRFINTRGGKGRNIPCDLHNEHVNKLIKQVITNMGGNMTDDALKRSARSVSTLQALCHKFDKCSGVPFGTHSHSTRSDVQDVGKVMRTVIDRKLLEVIPGRKHSSFPRTSANPLKSWDTTKTKEWIEGKKKQFVKFRGAIQAECDDSDSESEAESDND